MQVLKTMKARSSFWQAVATGILALTLSVTGQAASSDHDKNKNRKQAAKVSQSDKSAAKKSARKDSKVAKDKKAGNRDDVRQAKSGKSKSKAVVAKKRTKADRELARKERSRENWRVFPAPANPPRPPALPATVFRYARWRWPALC